MQRFHRITIVLAGIFLVMGAIIYSIEPDDDRQLGTFKVKQIDSEDSISNSLPREQIDKAKNKTQQIATKIIQKKHKKQIGTKTLDNDKKALSRNHDLINLELVNHLKDPNMDESYVDEYFDNFLTDESISRTDKMEAVWDLMVQLDPSDPGYNFLLDQLESTMPVELTEELIGEYETATKPGTKFMLLELMRDSIMEMEEHDYRVGGEIDSVNHGNDFDVSATQNLGETEREKMKQSFREFLRTQNEERGGVYEDEFEYEEFLESFASVYTLKETVSHMCDSIVNIH